MKELNIPFKVVCYQEEELEPADRQLIEAARQATYHSYAPYSHFSVGAAAIRRMPPIPRDSVPNALPCSMPTRNIPMWR